MPLEIEIKLKVPDHTPIRSLLQSLHAQHLGTVRETNIFFDRPDRSLLAANSGLRVRLTISPTDPTPQALLTFKGPPQSTGLHSRTAYDLTLAPADQIIPLLTSLGFIQTMLFEKDRDSWLLGACRVELDTLPHFGHYLEIEGPSEQAVTSAQSRLNLQSLPQQKQSYANMLADYLETHGKKELRF